MRRLCAILSTIIVLISYQSSYAQTTVFNSFFSNTLTACLNDATFTVNINNVSPYDFSETEILLILPEGISYVPSSVVGGTENGTVSGDSILFDLPNISKISNTTFSVQLTAGCMNSYTAKKNVVEFSYKGDNGIGGIINETLVHESSLYNVKFPNLSLVNMTYQTYTGDIGDSIYRCITIKNGGNGALAGFELEHDHGSGLNIVSATMGTELPNPNGTTYQFDAADFASIGNHDNFLDPGESIIICEDIDIVSCSDAQSTYKYRWGCNSEVCQELTDAANITFNSETPHLKFTPWDGFSNNANTGLGTNCYGNNTNGDFPSSLTIVNDGSGDAVNTVIDVADNYGGSSAWVSTNYYSSINISSLTIEVNGGGAVPFSPISTYAGVSKSCLPPDPKHGFVMNLDTIAPGDTIILRWNHFTCCPQVCDNNKRRSFLRWRFRGGYENKCGIDYDIPRSLSPNSHSYIYAHTVPDVIPGTMMDGETANVSFFADEFGLNMPRSSNDQFKYRLILPDGDCLNVDLSSLIITNKDEDTVNTPYTSVTSGDTIDFIFNSIVMGSGWNISFDVSVDCNNCTTSGNKEIQFQTLYVPDLNCACEMLLECSSVGIDVLCPTQCEGANLMETDAVRINLGLPDNNNDGIPDPGPHDMSLVKTNRLMYGDTLQISNESYIFNPNNLDFNSIVLKHDITNYGNRMSYDHSIVEVYRAANTTYYTSSDENIQFNLTTTGGTRTWKLGFDIHALASLGYPTGIHLESGDSVIVRSFYVNTSNIGGNIYTLGTESNMYATESTNFPTAPQNELLGCNALKKQFTLIGYYFTNSGENSQSTQNCDEIVLSQNYYLSIGPCCNNYAGGNLFPFEYRHWAAPGTMYVTFPDNYEYVSSQFNFTRTAGTHTTTSTSMFGLTPISISGNTVELDLYPFFGDQTSGNPILFGDDGFHGTIQVRIRPTCNVENGTKDTKYKWSYRTVDQIDPSGIVQTGALSTDPVTYNGPNLTMQSNILAINSNTGVDSWDLFFQNTSFSSNVNNFWIGATPGGAITADSILNLTTNTWYFPNANGIFDVPDIPTDSSATYRLYTSINSCSPADLDIYSGWGCSGVPNNLQDYECTPLNLTLSINPLTPAFDTQIDFLGDGSEELCDTLDFKITVRNYQLGFGYNMLTDITLPAYLTLIPNSSYLIFNGDTMAIGDPNNVSSNTYNWDLSNDSLLIDGLTGIIDATGNSYVIYFRAEPLCGFTSGERIFTMTSGESFCGSVHESDLNFSPPIILSNMTAPYSTDIKIDLDFITPCGPDNTTILTIINNGTNDFGSEDSIHFILPDGLTYDPNTYTAIHNAGIPQIAPVITNSGTQTILTWALLPGVSTNDSMSFSINLLPTPSDISCQNMELRANTSVLLTADCSVNGNTCTAGFITGDTSKLIYTYKTQLDILNTDADVHLNPDGSESLSGQIIVDNQGAALSDNYNLVYEIIQDLNGNGIINAGEPVVWTQTINTTIPGGAVDTLNFSNITVSDFCDGIVRFSLGDNPCFCSEIIVPMNISLSSTQFYDTICSQEALIISYPDLGGFSYSWNPATDLSDSTLPQPEFTAVNNGSSPVSYSFIRTIDKSICQQTDTSTIVVNPLPNAAINGSTAVCQDDTEPQITFTGTDGTAPYTFTYTVDDGTNTTTETISTTSGNSVIIDVPTNVVGTYTYDLVSVVDASSTTCSNIATSTVTITVNPLPTATIAGTVDICQDDTEPQITFTGADGTAPYIFTYTIDDGTNTTTETVISTGDIATVDAPTNVGGTFTYELVSVEDASSTTCSNPQTGTVVITVNPLPTATIDGTIDICQNDTEPQITFTGAPGTPPYTFTYTIDDGTNTTTETISTTSGNSVLVNTPTSVVGTFTYDLVSVQDNSSTTCSNNQTGTVVITVNPLPTATIAGTVDICQDDTDPQITFTGADGTAPYTFTYTVDDGTNTTTETVTTTGGNIITIDAPTDVAGTFTYDLVSVQDVSSTTCTNIATGTATIIVNPLPTATIGGTIDVCQDDAEPQITFTGADGTAPYTFTYTLDGSAPQTVSTTSGNSVTLDASTSVTGTFTYELVSVQDNSSTTCSNNQTGTVVIKVNPLPTATIDGSITVCQDDTEPQITFTGADGTAPYTFTYTVNNGTNTTTETVSTTAGNSVTVDAPTDVDGTFTYDLISVQDASSTTCSNNQSGTITITVNPLPTATIIGTTAVCQDDNEPIITFAGADGTAPYIFTYTLDDGVNTTTETVTTTSGNSIPVNVPTDASGTFTYDLVSVEDNSSTTCSNNQLGTVTITVNPLPDAAIMGPDKICQFETSNIVLEGINSTGDYTFTYNINSGANHTLTTNGGSGAIIPIPSDAPGTFEYELTNVVDPATGCNRDMSHAVTIEIIEQPVASFHPDPDELTSYQWESQMVNESVHANHFFWDFGDGYFSSEHSPIHEFPNEKTANYTIMLIAYSPDDLCIDTTYQIVQFKNELLFYVPNTFTPNGDKYNNTFLPVFTAGFDPNDYHLMIFNRWGEMIFESNDSTIGWDGTYKGKMVQDGTYIWKIEVQKTLTETREMFTGNVNLIR